MSGQLLVLVVDDCAEDARRFLQALEPILGPADHEWVGDREAFARAVTARQWDAILVGSDLPALGAVEVLRLIHEAALEVPVLIVSGCVGDTLAVYTLKSTPLQLTPEQRRDFREAAVRKRHRVAERDCRANPLDERHARPAKLTDAAPGLPRGRGAGHAR